MELRAWEGISVHTSSAAPDLSVLMSSTALAPVPQRPTTRLSQGIRKPKTYTDGTIRYVNMLSTFEEPATLHDALTSPHWKQAMDVEFDALQKKNKTWHLVPPQRGKMSLTANGGYKVKRKADGTIDKYKAR